MKERTVFVCRECGYESPKWFGRCPVCGAWNSAVEMKIDERGKKAPPSSLMKLSQVNEHLYERIKSGIRTLDMALGGGFVKGQVVLLGGEPGVGKSTLALQLASRMIENGLKVLYASGEESAEQIAMRAARIGASGEVSLTTDQDMDSVLKAMESFDVIVVDSIQTFYDPELGSVPGGVAQLRAITSKVMEKVKREGKIAILIGHVTKSGDIAGPKLVEHMVDTVLYFEGEKTTDYRILRVFKNRFGPSGEIAVFEMTGEGLVEVENPVFVDEEVPFGNAISCVMEGSSPIVVQVQALVSRSKVPSPRRSSIGIDLGRLSSIVAVMSKILKLPLEQHDVYVKVLGGLRIFDPAVDLAVAAAVFSSLLEAEIGKIVFMGEVGLDGRIRVPYSVSKRVDVLRKSGFSETAGPFKGATHVITHLSQLAGVIS